MRAFRLSQCTAAMGWLSCTCAPRCPCSRREGRYTAASGVLQQTIKNMGLVLACSQSQSSAPRREEEHRTRMKDMSRDDTSDIEGWWPAGGVPVTPLCRIWEPTPCLVVWLKVPYQERERVTIGGSSGLAKMVWQAEIRWKCAKVLDSLSSALLKMYPRGRSIQRCMSNWNRIGKSLESRDSMEICTSLA
jgi:hypothetical protein